MRNCHYWKKAGAKCAPSEIIVVDTETWHGDRAAVKGGELHRLRLGCALAYRLEHGKRTRLRRITFTDPAEFWTLVESRLSRQRPVWVFAHNAPYDLGVLGCWKRLIGGQVNVEKCAVSGQLFYLKCSVRGKGLILCDTLNYYKCSLASIGKAVGLPKMQMPEQEEPDSVWGVYCMNDVDVTAAGVDALIDFQRKNALGPWQPSIAGLAFSAYRACFMRDDVLVHDNSACLDLERGAYYGGLVDTPVIGRTVTGPVYELDVCSMYPEVCRKPLPIRKKGYSERIGLKTIQRLRDEYMWCADVTLETQDYTYPCRLKDGTYYPTGRYRTCLAHPELMHAIDAGAIKWIHRAAWYVSDPIFREYMETFVTKKSEYRLQGNEAFATLCKYYANSLYGKTGQMTPRWQQWDTEALHHLEDQYGLPEDTLANKYPTPPDLYSFEGHYRIPEIPDLLELRSYYGVTEVKVGEHESRDSCPVIAATVTSYARQLLRYYQQTAGAGHWYYSDTDSIWCDAIGRERLERAGCVRPDTLGYLDVKGEHAHLTVYGAKDYETDKVRRLKGIRPSAKSDGKGGWVQLHFPSAARQIRRADSEGVYVPVVTKHCHRVVTKVRVLDGGSTRPLVFPNESPEHKKGR